MKTLLKISVVALLLVSASAFANGTKDAIDVVGSKYENLFVFKTEKKLVGATVEVISENGDVITSQVLQKRKMIIDFCDVRMGSYTIRVKKGDDVKEFRYIKKTRI